MEKLEIARRQLGTALFLFVQNADPVSVHCLACGGGEIAEGLAKQTSGESFIDGIRQNFPDTSFREIKSIRNKYWNAFKHLTKKDGIDREDEYLLKEFSDDQNDAALLVGWWDYAQTGAPLPIEAQVFQVWFFAQNLDRLAPDADTEPYTQMFKNIGAMDRSKKKDILKCRITRARQDLEVMTDARTDTRPLMLT